MKTKLSSFLTDYGMLLVLALLFVIFSLSTFKEQTAEGYGAGTQLAEKTLASGAKEVVLIVGTSPDDAQVQQGFEEALRDKGVEIHIIAKAEPPKAKSGLKDLAVKVSQDCLIACSKKTGNWTFFNSVDKFKNSQILTPKNERVSSFLKTSNLKTLPDKTAKTAIIAIGMTMIIITAGIDLSVGSLVALATVVATLTLQNGFNNSSSPFMIAVSFVAGISAAGFCGFLSGAMTTAFKIPSFIVTLAMMLIARGLALNLTGNRTIKVGLPDISWLGQAPNPIILMVALYAIAYFVMHKTVLGRQIYAIGGNEEAARLSGVPVKRVLMIVYTISGVMAGIAGVVMASELNSGSGEFGQTWELNVIAAVVVGGTSLMGGQGKIIGTLIGCAIIEVINNGMNLMAISSNTQQIVLGCVILAAIVIDKIKKK
jgi:ribose transport system permease protein